MQGERMDTSGKLRSEHLIYHAVALDPALPFECPRYDIQSEMSFAARTMARMAGVAMRFIDDPQAVGFESFGQLPCDDVGHRHGFA
jgi:hypothetical protein